MADERASGNGSTRWPQTGIPLALVIVSLVVAVGAVSVLIYVLYRQTTGPGEVVHDYYEALAEGDCGAAYGLLAPTLREEVGEETFCAGFPEPASIEFEIRSVLLSGSDRDAAEVVVGFREGGRQCTEAWRLARDGRDWLIVELPEGPACPAPS